MLFTTYSSLDPELFLPNLSPELKKQIEFTQKFQAIVILSALLIICLGWYFTP